MRSHVKFSGQVEPGADLVRSPVTEQPCVYWRLRIVERLTVGSDLVHEMASSQALTALSNLRRVCLPCRGDWLPSRRTQNWLPSTACWALRIHHGATCTRPWSFSATL